MTASPIIGFDHPVIAVRDMKESRERYERLGFHVPPRGSHKEWGTGNWCIMFPHDYLELRGIVDPKRYTHKLDEFLARREGLMGVAFAGDRDNHEAHREFEARGLHPQPVRELTRRFELPEGEVEPSFRLLFFREDETGPLMASLICQHLTPELIRQPRFLQHANRVIGIGSMTAVAGDLEKAASQLAPYFNAGAVRREDNRTAVDVGRGTHFYVVTPEEAAREGIALDAKAPYLASITLRTESLAAAEQALLEGEVPYIVAGEGRLRVPANSACGVTLDFISA